MKTSYISILIATISTSVLVCCSKQSEMDPNIPENGAGQYCSLELSSVSPSDFQSKAAIDGTSFPQDGHIGLFLYTDEAASQKYGEGYEDVDYSYKEDKKKWTASPSIKVGSTPGYLYGYYPYKPGTQAHPVNIKAVPVESSLNGDDLMYVKKQSAITDKTAGNVSVAMSHALARVAITVVNKGYTGPAKLQSIKFEGAKIAESGTLNAVDGTVTASKVNALTLPVPEGNQQIAAGDGTVYECLLVPSAVETGSQTVTVTLTIDGEEKSATIYNGVIFRSGVKSRIPVNLNNSGISVGEVSIDDWQTVEVGDYKVTVKVDDNVAAHDILTEAYADGNNVIIQASSFQGKGLVCNVEENAKCEGTITNDKFTFTISEISSNIEAVLGYAPPVTLTVSSDTNGEVWIGDDKSKKSGQYEFGQQVVIHAVPNDQFRLFRWSDKGVGLNRTITVTGLTDATYSASFISADLIPGLITVNSSNKQVLFSKGNLYWDGTKHCLEDNQYSVPYSGDEQANHIGHFYWSSDADTARSLSNYSDNGATVNDVFFANHPEAFVVNGQKGWSVLTVGEWDYLLNIRKTGYGDSRRYACVRVKDLAGLLIFPDEFSWPTEAGIEPKTFNGGSDNWNERNYSVAEFNVLQDNGCVFLPAAGYRNGAQYRDQWQVIRIMGGNTSGYYWSASPYENDSEHAYRLDVSGSYVNPRVSMTRNEADSIRLVTEYQSAPSEE